MEDGFVNKVVMVTGATSGIGRAIAFRFGQSRARVVALARNSQVLQQVESEINAAGGQTLTISADVTNVSDVQRALESATQNFGELDVLVNAAGHISNGTIENTSLEAWDAMMNVNLRAVFQLMQLASPHLIKTKGNIVNVSSVTGLRSFPGVLAYCVSKAGVDQLTRCAALELAPQGIRVNAVNPGVVVTNLHRRSGMGEPQYAAFLERSKETHPLGRPGQAAEIAALILFLASDRAGWMTGETIPIDGGR